MAGLNEQQEAFCQGYSSHGDAERAAREAGYQAPESGWRHLCRPIVAARVRDLMVQRHLTPKVPELIGIAFKIAKDRNSKPADQLAAIKLLGQWARLDPVKAGVNVQVNNSLNSERGGSEVQTVIAQLARERQDRLAGRERDPVTGQFMPVIELTAEANPGE